MAVVPDIPVERDDALRAVDHLLRCAADAEGAVLLIEAAAGLGKTTILREACRRAAAAGLAVAATDGSELEQAFPFGAARHLLDRLLAGVPATERTGLFDGAARLAVPVLGAGPAAAPATGDPLYGLYWLVANLSERGPLLLAVDDLQWIDGATQRWLHYIARRLEGLPVGLLIATRPGSDAALGALRAQPVTRAIGLELLSEDGSDAVLRRDLGAGCDRAFAAACHVASGGNPFLLSELAASLRRDAVAPVAASVARVREVVPTTVAHSVTARLRGLGPEAAPLARAVATLGADVRLVYAASLAGMPVDPAARAADALAAAGILRPGLPLEFSHPLVRGAVHDELPAAERAVWHARAARLLAEAGEPAERVAAQLLRCDPAGDAWVVARLRDAAADATARGDPRAAVTFLRRAFAEPAGGEDRRAVLRELLTAGFVGGDDRALDDLGVDADAELEADPSWPHLAFMRAMQLAHLGRTSDANGVRARAVEVAVARGDTELALQLEVRLSILADDGDPTSLLHRLRRFRGGVSPTSPAGWFIRGIDVWLASTRGHSARDAAELARGGIESGELVRALHDDRLMIGSLFDSLVRTDDLDLCSDLVDQVVASAARRGDAPSQAMGTTLAGALHFLRGDLQGARERLEVSAAGIQALRMTEVSYGALALYVDVLSEAGAEDDAQRILDANGFDGVLPVGIFHWPLLLARGKLRLLQGRHQEGVDDLITWGSRFEALGLVPRPAQAWASHAAPLMEDRREARRLAELELTAARVWDTPRAIGQALRGLGLVVGGDKGLDILREAVVNLEASPARLELARALIDLGAALRRANQRSTAQEPLRHGHELARACGAWPLVERAADELRATGARPRSVVLTGVASLTASERRVADLAAGGMTNREVAQALFVTIKTVETHLSHVFQKLDIASRRQLAPLLRDGPS